MADQNAAKKVEDQEQVEGEEGAEKKKDRKPIVLTLLLVVNSVFLLCVGFGLYYFVSKVQEATQKQTTVQEDDAVTPPALETKLVSFEPIYVNLNGSEGYKVLKVTMSMEVENTEVQDEISRRETQIKDIILVLLSSKTYGEVSGENAKRLLKEEIIDTVNSFLTKGKIKKILITEFLFN